MCLLANRVLNGPLILRFCQLEASEGSRYKALARKDGSMSSCKSSLIHRLL